MKKIILMILVFSVSLFGEFYADEKDTTSFACEVQGTIDGDKTCIMLAIATSDVISFKVNYKIKPSMIFFIDGVEPASKKFYYKIPRKKLITDHDGYYSIFINGKKQIKDILTRAVKYKVVITTDTEGYADAFDFTVYEKEIKSTQAYKNMTK